MKEFVFSLFVLVVPVIYAQDQFTPPVIPPAPNAAQMTRFGDIPVSYYTGTPSISIPIHPASASL